jgi:hypothetical protein
VLAERLFGKPIPVTPGGFMTTATDQRPPPLVLLLHDHTSVVEIIAYLKDNGLRVESRRKDADILATVLDVDPT